MRHEYPVSSAQDQVLSALGLHAEHYPQAEAIFESLDLEVRPVREGRRSVAHVTIGRGAAYSGFNAYGEGEVVERIPADLDLSPLRALHVTNPDALERRIARQQRKAAEAAAKAAPVAVADDEMAPEDLGDRHIAAYVRARTALAAETGMALTIWPDEQTVHLADDSGDWTTLATHFGAEYDADEDDPSNVVAAVLRRYAVLYSAALAFHAALDASASEAAEAEYSGGYRVIVSRDQDGPGYDIAFVRGQMPPHARGHAATRDEAFAAVQSVQPSGWTAVED